MTKNMLNESNILILQGQEEGINYKLQFKLPPLVIDIVILVSFFLVISRILFEIIRQKVLKRETIFGLQMNSAKITKDVDNLEEINNSQNNAVDTGYSSSPASDDKGDNNKDDFIVIDGPAAKSSKVSGVIKEDYDADSEVDRPPGRKVKYNPPPKVVIGRKIVGRKVTCDPVDDHPVEDAAIVVGRKIVGRRCSCCDDDERADVLDDAVDEAVVGTKGDQAAVGTKGDQAATDVVTGKEDGESTPLSTVIFYSLDLDSIYISSSEEEF